jgi:hypothetical protein
LVTAIRGLFVETSWRRPGGQNQPLVVMESSEFRRHQIGFIAKIAETFGNRDRKPRSGAWKLGHIAKSRIEESPLSLHFQISYKRVPVKDGPPAPVQV